jgi:two-component system, sensor histidine kinase and response regulator
MSQPAIAVLLIEDNAADVRLIHELLRDATAGPFTFRCTDRLRAGLECVRSTIVDVILLDLTLPDSVGLDTFRIAHAEAPDVPIVVLTALSDESLAIVALREGAQDYLVKGRCDGDLLARSIRYAIERSRSDRDRVRQDAEIRGLNEALERRVEERTHELEDANAELGRREEALQAANGELEAFTYSVSHDLRAPIRQIDGFARILDEQCRASLDGKGQHYLERIQEGAARMGHLVDDLLSLARVGRQDLCPRSVSLGALVQQVREDLLPETTGRQIRWTVDTLPAVDCDPGLMKVVFTNLLSNAVKYTRPSQAASIEVGCTQQMGRAVIFIRDNGVGFDMKYAGKLFGVFQRLHRADEFEGTGVGLATVQRIVHMHGGEIWADAELGHGATFSFTLSPLIPVLGSA